MRGALPSCRVFPKFRACVFSPAPRSLSRQNPWHPEYLTRDFSRMVSWSGQPVVRVPKESSLKPYPAWRPDKNANTGQMEPSGEATHMQFWSSNFPILEPLSFYGTLSCHKHAIMPRLHEVYMINWYSSQLKSIVWEHIEYKEALFSNIEDVLKNTMKRFIYFAGRQRWSFFSVFLLKAVVWSKVVAGVLNKLYFTKSKFHETNLRTNSTTNF